MRYLMFLSLLVISVASTGCCGSFGPGCGALNGGCYDCDGGFGPRYQASGPIDALREAKRSLVCGGGCGEVYYGEWISTPPYCNDPCCGDQFTGGGVRAQPFCTPFSALRPRNLLVNLYGKRFCDESTSCDSCTTCCDSCGDGESYGSPVMSHPSPGCSSCAANSQRTVPQQQQSQVARQAPPVPQATARPPQRTAVRTDAALPTNRQYR
jgi:hypothetical protein